MHQSAHERYRLVPTAESAARVGQVVGIRSARVTAPRRLGREPWLRRALRNLPFALLQGAILTFIGTLLGAVVPGVPLLLLGESAGILLGMEVGGILFGGTAFLSGLTLSLPPRAP